MSEAKQDSKKRVLNGISASVQALVKPEFRDELEEYAAENGMTLTGLGRFLLEQHFQKKGWNAELFKNPLEKLKNTNLCVFNVF